jgi:hypothetical protein
MNIGRLSRILKIPSGILFWQRSKPIGATEYATDLKTLERIGRENVTDARSFASSLPMEAREHNELDLSQMSASRPATAN